MSSPGPSIEGIFRKDDLNWHDRHYVGRQRIDSWVRSRVDTLPHGAYVKISIEVLDPHPEKK